MDYLEEQDLLLLCSYDIKSQQGSQSIPQFQVVRPKTGRVIYSQNFPETSKPSAVTHVALDGKRTLIYLGVTMHNS
jgi:hypothetical protein